MICCKMPNGSSGPWEKPLTTDLVSKASFLEVFEVSHFCLAQLYRELL